MIPLPTLGGNNGWGSSVNDQNEVVGYAENTTIEPTCAGYSQVWQFKPVVWIGGRVHELPMLPGDSVGMGFAINSQGQATGWTGNNCAIAVHAVLWHDGTVTDLGNLGGAMNNWGYGMNDRGQVVGASDLPGDDTADAFLWQNGVMHDLGTLSGDFGSGANGINNKGQVVGASWDAAYNWRAILWQNGVMTDLNTLIPADSPLFLITASGGINDQGQIAGIAQVISTGEVHAFLATPTTEFWPIHECPRVVLSEHARKLLQQRHPFRQPGSGFTEPQ